MLLFPLLLLALVFPTPVGVFPPSGKAGNSKDRLPHARGGVSNASLVAPAVATSSPRPWGCFP